MISIRNLFSIIDKEEININNYNNLINIKETIQFN